MPGLTRFLSNGHTHPNQIPASRSARGFIASVMMLMFLLSATTTLAAKPRIEIQDPPQRESCNMYTIAWEWDLRIGDYGFTTTMCDAQGVPCWNYSLGTGWYTGSIDVPYPNEAGQALITPTWTVGPDNYLMEIEHWFDTESGYDGGNVKINGQLVEPVGGYPGIISVVTSYYAWCVDEEPGFTGNTAAWVIACFDLSPWMGQEISVEFEFGSDDGYSSLGWVLAGITFGTLGPQTYVVTPDGTGDFATIQAAIDAAIPGDTIVLGDGMFTGDGNRDLDFKGKAITVRSESGDPELCTINCEGYFDDPHFGFVFHDDEGLDSVLDGVSIIQGFYTSFDGGNLGEADAAGITCSRASPTVRNCVISFGTALLAEGGAGMVSETGLAAAGVAVYQATPVFQDCQIISNTITIENISNDGQAGWINPQAGGVACLEAKPVFENCIIANNIAEISATPIPLPGPEVLKVVIGGGMAVLDGVMGEIFTTDYCHFLDNAVIMNLSEAPDSEISQLSIAGGMAQLIPQSSGLVGYTPAPMFIDNTVTINDLAGYQGELIVGGGMSWSGGGMSLVNPGLFGNSVELPPDLDCFFIAAGAIAALESAVAVDLGEFSGNWVSATPIPLPDPPAPNTLAGAVAGMSSFLTADNCNFSSNQVSATPIPLPDPPAPVAAAGAVTLQRSGALLSGCTFNENTFELGQNLDPAAMDTLFCAGAMVQLETETTATSCEFHANQCLIGEEEGPGLEINVAAAAGGLLQSSGQVLLMEAQFIGNSARIYGSGPHLIAGGAVTDPITYTRGVSCLFGGNTTNVSGSFDDVILGGGGSFGEQSQPDLEGCHLWDNQALLNGPDSPNLATVAGGLACRADLPLVAECGFYHNSGTLGVSAQASLAGAVAFQNGSPEISACVLEGNSATSNADLFEECAVAGGLAFRGSVATLTGSTLAFNSGVLPMRSAAGGVDCRQNTTLTVANTIIAFSEQGSAVESWDGGNVELSCSDIFGNMGGDWVGYIEDQLDANGNISEDPLFCGDLNPDGALTLSSNSPCSPTANPDCGLIGALEIGCTVSGVDDQMPVPSALKLHHGYPNPFNPQATIKFDLPAAQQVKLSIYTLAGEMVTTLVNEVRPAGHHEAIWNGRDAGGREMSSGTYLVRLETGSGVKGSKLMLVR